MIHNMMKSVGKTKSLNKRKENNFDLNTKQKLSKVEALTSSAVPQGQADVTDKDDLTDGIEDASASNDESKSIALLQILGRRLDIFASKAMKHLRSFIFPLLMLQLKKKAHFELRLWSDELVDSQITQAMAEVSILIELMKFLNCHQDLFLSPRYKKLRCAMHPLVLYAKSQQNPQISSTIQRESTQQSSQQMSKLSNDQNYGFWQSNISMTKTTLKQTLPLQDANYSTSVTTAFRNQQWTKALEYIYNMIKHKEIPKLGAIQRWVRDCDTVITVNHSQNTLNSSPSTESNSVHDLTVVTVNTHESSVKQNISNLLLESIIRLSAASAHRNDCKITSKLFLESINFIRSDNFIIPTTCMVHRYPPFTPSFQSSLAINTTRQHKKLSQQYFKLYKGETKQKYELMLRQKIKIVSHIPGSERRPPRYY